MRKLRCGRLHKLSKQPCLPRKSTSFTIPHSSHKEHKGPQCDQAWPWPTRGWFCNRSQSQERMKSLENFGMGILAPNWIPELRFTSWHARSWGTFLFHGSRPKVFRDVLPLDRECFNCSGVLLGEGMGPCQSPSQEQDTLTGPSPLSVPWGHQHYTPSCFLLC